MTNCLDSLFVSVSFYFIHFPCSAFISALYIFISVCQLQVFVADKVCNEETIYMDRRQLTGQL
jgi:hypothetical protein